MTMLGEIPAQSLRGQAFRTFGPEYIERFGDDIPIEHRKVIHAITVCRTQEAGTATYACEQCVINGDALNSLT